MVIAVIVPSPGAGGSGGILLVLTIEKVIESVALMLAEMLIVVMLPAAAIVSV